MLQRALIKFDKNVFFQKNCYRYGLIMCTVVHKTCHQKKIWIVDKQSFIIFQIVLVFFFADFKHVNGRWNVLLPYPKFLSTYAFQSWIHVTFKTKIYVKTVNNSFQHHYLFLSQKAPSYMVL